jgi:hydroxymethylpyrimidine/phosphomethylpyrimidine kinase
MGTPPIALTIGGSDSAGRCGLQADLRTFAALEVHGATVVTIVTAQDTVSVRSAWPVPHDAVAAQLMAVLDDLDVAAAKTGMLGRVELVKLVAEIAAGGQLPSLVVDPVLVDGSGQALFSPEVVQAYLDHLLPRATAVTPNRDELALLTGRPLADLASVERACIDLAAKLNGPLVLATGGRLAGGPAIDIVAWKGDATHLTGQRHPTVNTAGSGDALSAALTAGLAHGLAPDIAAEAAKAFVSRALAGAARWRMGAGRGPLDHLDWAGSARARI